MPDQTVSMEQVLTELADPTKRVLARVLIEAWDLMKHAEGRQKVVGKHALAPLKKAMEEFEAVLGGKANG